MIQPPRQYLVSHGIEAWQVGGTQTVLVVEVQTVLNKPFNVRALLRGTPVMDRHFAPVAQPLAVADLVQRLQARWQISLPMRMLHEPVFGPAGKLLQRHGAADRLLL